ncbi:hypothetical protein B296_00023245 [Ensete ventricosum]|uniref:Uncharacterized protein n=1 Tax=Ensete ventricosum TaxID=4639 RepID=A0A426Z0T9_ENSVE|nr:hypothetical protein B296_00023245 [Ensete ventricosum]
MGLFRLVTGLPGPSGFGSASTAEQVTDGIDASHLTVIITGASPAPIFFVPLSTALSSAVPLMAVRGAKITHFHLLEECSPGVLCLLDDIKFPYV